MAEKDGHEITADASQADVLVVNTCAFIDRAKQESIDTILEMAELKKQAAGRKLVVTGCLAERYRDELKKEIPEIDAIYGTGEVEGLSQLHVGNREPGTAEPGTAKALSRSTRSRRCSASILPTYIYDADTPRKRVTPRPLRLREDRRRLRLQVRLLHHPEDARPLSQPPDRVDRAGSASARRARRQGTAAHLAGLDVLRHRSRRARRAAEAATCIKRSRRASSGSGCSTSIRRRSPATSSTRSPISTRS